jgi:hypothetical protein
MILFLRNNKNQSIVDLEVWVKTEDNNSFIELQSVVIIETYSKFLLKNLDRKTEIIEDFSIIDELRGWLWENYFGGEHNDPKKYPEVLLFLRTLLKKIAEKYDLIYVED